jgi:hypothetical protein
VGDLHRAGEDPATHQVDLRILRRYQLELIDLLGEHRSSALYAKILDPAAPKTRDFLDVLVRHWIADSHDKLGRNAFRPYYRVPIDDRTADIRRTHGLTWVAADVNLNVILDRFLHNGNGNKVFLHGKLEEIVGR